MSLLHARLVVELVETHQRVSHLGRTPSGVLTCTGVGCQCRKHQPLAFIIRNGISEMHPYPLIRSGGLFLIIIAAMIIAGAPLPRARNKLVAAGLALASIVTA